MRPLKVNPGQKIKFLYSNPKNGPIERKGTIQYIKRASTTPERLIIFNIFDETVGDYRSFHFNKMHEIALVITS